MRVCRYGAVHPHDLGWVDWDELPAFSWVVRDEMRRLIVVVVAALALVACEGQEPRKAAPKPTPTSTLNCENPP